MGIDAPVERGPLMALSNLPGPWDWKLRDEHWWRIHRDQGIEDGPHARPYCHDCKLSIVIDPYGGSSAWVHMSNRANHDHEVVP
jgi:hypothetical protein